MRESPFNLVGNLFNTGIKVSKLLLENPASVDVTIDFSDVFIISPFKIISNLRSFDNSSVLIPFGRGIFDFLFSSSLRLSKIFVFSANEKLTSSAIILNFFNKSESSVKSFFSSKFAKASSLPNLFAYKYLHTISNIKLLH